MKQILFRGNRDSGSILLGTVLVLLMVLFCLTVCLEEAKAEFTAVQLELTEHAVVRKTAGLEASGETN